MWSAAKNVTQIIISAKRKDAMRQTAICAILTRIGRLLIVMFVNDHFVPNADSRNAVETCLKLIANIIPKLEGKIGDLEESNVQLSDNLRKIVTR
mmetsp:Transcript_25442/g.45960  ORF Transcript_25442/g.45960 Transcript_25442/m.45960 type:complete len:95 (+) Transcript_25442:75-359(+)